MGRYYNGDIEGKFWFGVQSSNDGEFFGAREYEPNVINYAVEDIKPVEDGIQACLNELGDDLKILDDFFDSLEFGYNDDMIIKWYKNNHNQDIDKDFVKNKLEWYARLELGNDIHECMKRQGYCYFEAET